MTTLMAESEEELKSLLMKVKEEAWNSLPPHSHYPVLLILQDSAKALLLSEYEYSLLQKTSTRHNEVSLIL